MTFSHAPVRDIEAIVAEFASVAWPLGRRRLASLAERFGWNPRVDGERSVIFVSSIAGESAMVSVSVADGDIAEVDIDVSVRIGKDDAEQQEDLTLAFKDLRRELTGILGSPAASRSGKNPRTSWDLDNGGRVALQRLSAVIQLVILQERYANIERFEESREILDDRDPSAYLS